MNNRLFSLTLALSMLLLPLVVSAESRTQRRIYLLDVSMSMHGRAVYDGVRTPDIYDEVIDFIEKDIRSISDENTEILICPFEEGIYETVSGRGTLAGKDSLVNRIRSFDYEDFTKHTYIYRTLSTAVEMLSDTKHNMVILLTDGKDEDPEGNQYKDKFFTDWRHYVYKNFAYLLFVQLTGLVESGDIESLPAVDIVPPGESIPTNVIDLTPIGEVTVNIKDDSEVNIPLSYKKGVTLPEGLKISVESSVNDYVRIDEVSVLDMNILTVDVEYLEEYDDLKLNMTEEVTVPLRINLVNGDEIRDSANQIFCLTRENVSLRLINKPEKTLKISLK